MTANTADNFTQLPHNGEYGNKSTIVGEYANLATSSAAALDTFDLVKIPAGGQVVSGFLYTTQMTGTSTWVIGARAADGSSTGGTTGTAVVNASIAITGTTLTAIYPAFWMKFKPFMNDFDTIIYATHVTGPAHTANDNIQAVFDYVAKGTK